MSTSLSISGSAAGSHSCGCVGPQNGEPRCPCQMRGIIERDGRWIEPERDLGPVRRYENAGKFSWTLADATKKETSP